MLAEWARAALNSCGFGFKADSFFFARSLFVNSKSFCSSFVSSNLSARAGPDQHASPAAHRHTRTAKRGIAMTSLRDRGQGRSPLPGAVVVGQTGCDRLTAR